jgi:hypothetical protein
MGEAAAPKPDAAPVLLALRKLGLLDGDKSGAALRGSAREDAEGGNQRPPTTIANISNQNAFIVNNSDIWVRLSANKMHRSVMKQVGIYGVFTHTHPLLVF